MTTVRQPTQGTGTLRPAQPVVAAPLTWNGRIGLFKRSAAVGHDDGGRWHCITGYLRPGNHPPAQALDELREEARLRACDLTKLTTRPANTPSRTSTATPGPSPRPTHPHPSDAQSSTGSTTNRWVRPGSAARFDG